VAVLFQHRSRVINRLLWKLQSLSSGWLQGGTRAGPANEADRMSKRSLDFTENLADRICDCGRTASRKEKSNRLVTATISHNERPRIAARAESGAIDDYLVRVTDDVFLTLAATDLILHVHTCIDRPDRSHRRSCCAPTFFHR